MSLQFLNSQQLEYVIFHLNQHVDFSHFDRIQFIHSDESILPTISNKIIFYQSSNNADLSRRITFFQQSIPNLFPCSDSEEIYYLDDKGNLIFNHDWLKAAFLFLSGWQETQPTKRDWLGRFPHNQSLQHQLGVTTIPVVNYYFEIIVSGIETFCKYHSLPFARKRLFENFGFFLSHDVDRIAFYHPREVAFKIKQLVGLSPRYYSWTLTLKLFVQGLVFLVNPFRKNDPWWNFEQMMLLEKELGIRSTFYFLKQEHTNMDSRYSFHDQHIKQLINQLQKDNFEVGLHGTIRSAEDEESMQLQANELSAITGETPIGIRQHFLRFFYPSTFYNQIKAGLKYDASLGFAEHEGFRNGYCYPFKPYDFDRDKMIDIWEIPLMLMEVSVLNYRNQSLSDVETASMNLISEVKKFGGFYSLLWHNCRLDEYQFPGVTKCYRYLLKKIMLQKPEVVRGVDIYNKQEAQ